LGFDLAEDLPDYPSQAGLEFLEGFAFLFELFGMVVAPDLQEDRFIGMAGSGGIGLFGLLFKTLPIDTLSQFDERMFRIDEISQQTMMPKEGHLLPLDS
jgi:hypothetical protein